MRAVTYERYGRPEVLGLEELPQPSPGRGELLLRVHATEVTKTDCEMRRGRFAVSWYWLPLRLFLGLRRPRRRILGLYFAGTVESLGAEVDGFRPGQAVFGCVGLRMGACGEFMTLPADATLAPLPQRMSFAEAAAVPLGGLNALHFLRRAAIRNGESVLIIGAGGSIGCFAVQIARALGARVTAVDAGHKEALVRSLGAEAFIDYRKADFAKGGQRHDVVFNTVAGLNYTRCLRVLRPGGRYLLSNPRLSDMLRAVFTSRFSDRKVQFAFAAEKPEELMELRAMIESGALRSIVDRVYPLEDAVKAHHRVESEERQGAIVLRVWEGAD